MNFKEILEDVKEYEGRFENFEDFIEKRDINEKRFYMDKTHIIGLGTILSTEYSKIVNNKNIHDNYAEVDNFEYDTIDTPAEPKVECVYLTGDGHRLYIDKRYFIDVLSIVNDKCKLLISKYEWQPLLIETELKDEQDQTYYFAIAPACPEDS